MNPTRQVGQRMTDRRRSRRALARSLGTAPADLVAFLRDRFDWPRGHFVSGTGVASTARGAVVIDLVEALAHGDELEAGLDLQRPTNEAEIEALAMVARELVRQTDSYGQPLPHQVRGLAQACIRVLEREVR